MLATILAGMLSPMQSAVNGQLGHWLQDGNACAVISFASGLVVMFLLLLRKETRQQFASIPTLIKKKNPAMELVCRIMRGDGRIF